MSLRPARKPTFVRFSQLTRENSNRDFQVHTALTDGEGTVQEVLDRARGVGLAELAFTEHARATSSYYPSFFSEIDNLALGTSGLTVYRGFEVKVLDRSGALDMSPDMRAAADLVLASVHSFPAGNGKVAAASTFSKEEAYEIEFMLAAAAIERGQADVLSHAGGMCLRNFGSFPWRYLEELVTLAAKREMAFEINTSYHSDILDRLLPLLERHDPLVSVGSDVHRLEELGRCRDRLRQVLGL